MRIVPVIVTLVLLTGTPLVAQTKGDRCHVYIWDLDAAKRAAELTGNREQAEKAIMQAMTMLPFFETRIEEEVFTTKHYPLLQTKLTITASVYYTDESMPREVDNKQVPADSVSLGIAITNKAEENALFDINDNAVTEVAYDQNTSRVRVRKQVQIGARTYVIGLQCDCNVSKVTAR